MWDDATDGRPSRPAPSPDRTSAAVSGHPVLLVEDNEINRMIALEMLEYLNCSVEIAVDGRDAVDAASRRVYALILMDCGLPEMDGFDACRRIREMEGAERRKRVPIVALTGDTSGENLDRCLSSGMDDRLCKPFKIECLREVLEKWLEA